MQYVMKSKMFFILLLMILGACSKWVAPPYTSVENMLQLEQNMNQQRVNQTLGITPYNILHRNEETTILEYHYRLKDREVNNISNFDDFIHEEVSQTGGEAWYDKPSKFYLLLENNRLSSLITENGLENSDFLLLKNNNLLLVSRSELVKFKLWEDASYLHQIDNTTRLKAKNSLKHSITTMTNLPYGLLGVKYAFMGKFGGYASTTLSPEDGFTYLTGGFLYKTNEKASFYIGAGVGPDQYTYYYSNYVEEVLRGLKSPVIEAGTLLFLNKFSLDLGLGVNTQESVYAKIGLGINF